ncbi:helix-turn-helix domain-containing protein [Tissierella sp. MSJ-40]|uniref:Helix-turn-helix domain-containing protein n=2 Tax=Tissierella simiarum TaxID=2841534 RepID=A0ABS6E4K4_9FIRM|nr:helix-turn-helix domain-containing protein [Tissierella simiarum]
MHWHGEIEIILVLQGTINIRVGNERFLLEENDLILINKNEVHNTSKTKEDNMLLVLQINPEYYSSYYPRFNKMIFNCKSFLYGKEEQKSFDMIRHHLAKIVWELNKKREGYQLIIGAEAHLLAAFLVNNFDHTFIEDEKSVSMNKDIVRLQSIINYINRNMERRITLQEIADNEQLSVYYLSHFIKKNMGMSFQEYLNNIRLDKTVNLLLNSDKTITEISYESGFASTKSLNKLFKDVYDCSPSEYRKAYGNIVYNENKDRNEDSNKKKSRTYLDVDRKAAFKRLFSYLKGLDNEVQDENTFSTTKDVISVDVRNEGVNYKPYWKKLITYSRAVEGLRKGWQNQFEELQNDIGFEYIRFHSIFSDDMMVYNLSEEGHIIYNWSYVDELLDYFKKVNIKPFIELGFMPSEIKSLDETVFWWRANISQPRDIKLWTDLVVEFIKHCINRYGLKEVETWYFEVWNEPDLEYFFWIGGKEAYFKFYEATAWAVKSVSNKLKVGGPSITHQAISDSTWLEDFLIYCNKNDVPLDFVSLHIYSESYSSKEKVQDIMLRAKQGESQQELMAEWREMQRIYFGKDHTYDTLNSANDKINRLLSYNTELHITEWNASSYSRNLIHDTCFMSTFIISNILKSINIVDSIGYWTFTDIMEEAKAGISPFHGGFGLINNNGLKKPSYFAYYFLSKLGEKIIEQNEEYIITKSGEDIQILVYNHTYFDDLFLNGDTSALTNTERYLVYEEKAEREVEININGISGKYKITRYQLNREYGSVFDEWIKMGTPENMTQEELNYLKGKAYPKITVEYLNLDEYYKEKLYIPVHGIELMTLEKKL